MRKNPTNGHYMSFNNRRHKILSPEEMSTGILYSCTLNPSTQPLSPKFTLDLITWHNGMDNIFKCLKYSTVILYPELSSGSRWHYHGTLSIANVMKFFIFDLPFLREHFSFEIDTIADLTKWTAYCTKQTTLMKPITKEHGIPYKYESDKIMKVKSVSLNDTKFTELIKLEQYDDEENLE